MDKYIKNILKIIFGIIYITLLLVIGYQIISAILGGTWETENIIIGALGIIMAGIFAITGFLINQGKTIGMLDERTKNIGRSLSTLGSDFKQHISRGG